MLPLVGCGEHDWAALLGEWGWLSQDGALADAVHLVGVVLYLGAIVGGWYLLRREPQQKLATDEHGQLHG